MFLTFLVKKEEYHGNNIFERIVKKINAYERHGEHFAGGERKFLSDNPQSGKKGSYECKTRRTGIHYCPRQNVG